MTSNNNTPPLVRRGWVPPGWAKIPIHDKGLPPATVLKSPYDQSKEKAFGMWRPAQNGRMPFFIAGFGEMYIEDMKEMCEKIEAKHNKFAVQLSDKRLASREAIRLAWLEVLENRKKDHLRAHRTNPVPIHARS